jgi:hypothetical protein
LPHTVAAIVEELMELVFPRAIGSLSRSRTILSAIGIPRGSVALLLLSTLCACSAAQTLTSPGTAARPDAASVAAARKQWREKAFSGYVVEETRLCECAPIVTAAVRLTVRRGPGAGGERIERAVSVATGNAVTSAVGAQPPLTVEALFDLVDRAITARAARVEMELDPALGYPRRVYIDYDTTTADDEIIYELVSLAPTNT